MNAVATKKKNQNRNFLNQNPIESIRDLGTAVAKSAVSDLARPAVADMFSQFLGIDNRPQNGATGDLVEGQELDLSAIGKREQEYIEPGLDYRAEVLHAERRITQQDNRAIEVKIEEILVELKKLVSSSKELEIAFKDVAVAQAPVKPGKYHENFFEWVLSTIKHARARVEESLGWMSAIDSKKNKREYWQMFKKHGTTFGLSNERVVATQVG